MKRLVFSLFILLSLNLLVAEAYHGFTIDSWPPFMYVENGQVTGIATEIVSEVFRISEIDFTVDAVPWTRAYKNAMEQEGTFIYLLYRTEEREPLFKWVGPIVPAINTSLYKLKKRTDIELDSLEDAKNYRIGVVRGVANHKYLIDQGFAEGVNLEAVATPGQNIEKIILERIDLIINTEYTLPRLLQGTGLSRDDFEVVLTTVESEPGYIGLNIATPDSIVEKLGESYETLKRWGVIDKIFDKYIR